MTEFQVLTEFIELHGHTLTFSYKVSPPTVKIVKLGGTVGLTASVTAGGGTSSSRILKLLVLIAHLWK